MKRLILGAVVLLLALMALSPVATLAADPPGMQVEIVVIGDDVVVYVNGDQLANQADIANAMGKLTGSGADLWMWNTVHNLDDFARATGINIRLLMDAQAKTILENQAQQVELEQLGGRLVDLDNGAWSVKMAAIENNADIELLENRLAETDMLLLKSIGETEGVYQWAEVNNEYWNNRVVTLEARINDLQEQKGNDDLMVYGGYGLAVCFLAVFVVGVKKHRG